MRYTEYIEECAASLAAEKRAPSDSILIYYVRMMRHAEEICETFGYNDLDQSHQMNDDKILVCVNAFAAMLNHWKMSLPLSISCERFTSLPSFSLAFNDAQS